MRIKWKFWFVPANKIRENTQFSVPGESADLQKHASHGGCDSLGSQHFPPSQTSDLVLQDDASLVMPAWLFFLEGLVCAEKSQGKSGKKPTIFRPDLAAMPGSSFQKDNKRARPAEGVTQQFGHIWPLCTDKHDLQPTLLGSDLAKFEHFRSTWILAKRF